MTTSCGEHILIFHFQSTGRRQIPGGKNALLQFIDAGHFGIKISRAAEALYHNRAGHFIKLTSVYILYLEVYS